MYKKGFWYVYLLLCDQKTFYVGITPEVRIRIQDHISKEPLYTRRFSEVKLLYCEKYTTKHKAALREKQVKGWSHVKKQMLIDRKIDDPHCIELDEVLG
ncbi:MAG: GIY-YIG nuclease superfamily protein [Microgenomates bacterium OLB22]|nr:MAG: GIY-YIG nuclease superfamily protein [Microgenomates bacterium OLB22]